MVARRGMPKLFNINDLRCPTSKIAPIDIVGKNLGMSNRNSELIVPKENAAFGATDSGLQKNSKAPNLRENKSKRAHDLSLTYARAQMAHSASARAMDYALTLCDYDGWIDAGKVWALRLTEEEVANLACVSLRLLSPEVAQQVVEHLSPTSSCPITPLFGADDEADSRTMYTSNDELKAYLLACFDRLASEEQKEFITYTQRRSAASSSNRGPLNAWGGL